MESVMGCSATGFRTFLLSCNVGLSFTGLAILILGIKMNSLITMFSLSDFPMLMKTVKAVIATGFVITVTGGTGFCGSCYEVQWLLMGHLAGLGIIVVMEFCLGVTMMVIKNTIEKTLESMDCGEECMSTMRSLITDLALPSAGLMMTIIAIEGLMIYSAIKLYFYLRDCPKLSVVPFGGPTVVVQNVQMQNVASSQPSYGLPSHIAPPPQTPYVAPPPTHLYTQQFVQPQSIYSPGPSTPHPQTPLYGRQLFNPPPPSYAEVTPQRSSSVQSSQTSTVEIPATSNTTTAEE